MAGFAPQWEKRYSLKLVWTDISAILVALLVAHLLAFEVMIRASALLPKADAVEFVLDALLLSVIYGTVWLVALSVNGSRQPAMFGTGPEEYNRVLTATFMSFGVVTLVLYLTGISVHRTFLFAALAEGTMLLILGRLVWRKRLQQQRRKKLNTYRTLLVGERRKSAYTAQQLRRNVLAGFEIVGGVSDADGARELVPGVPVVADYEGIFDAVQHWKIDTIIVTSSDSITPRWLRELGWELEALNVDLIVATALTDIAGPRIHARPVAGLPLIHVEYPQFQGWRYFAKRSLDLFGSLLAIILTSPLLVLLAVLVSVDSRGPVLFKQQRIGLQGRPFTMYKFRSMQVDAENALPGLLDRNDGNSVLFKIRDDPRVTPIGRFIRRHSLDELPQIFNVFKGDMSLVGPRPPLSRETEKYEQWVNRRMFVRPGISGLWQVSGRSNLTWDESVRIDLYYVENWSLVGDLLILWRTLRVVFRGDGAY